ncbi:MAG TPA: hypothetical protein VMF03_19895 [Steroidobacteraceae bacterium]|nr:hypothetical protein [Steroidobacteraceae bacterium]
MLLLARLALGNVAHLPVADAAVRASAASQAMMMMAGEPCPEMAGGTADHLHPAPGNDGACCKSLHCSCLHAPALMVTVPMPPVSRMSYAEVSFAPLPLRGDPPAVFFRPPI